MWTNSSFKAPLISSAVACILGNTLYCIGYDTKWLSILMAARLLTGLGKKRTEQNRKEQNTKEKKRKEKKRKEKKRKEKSMPFGVNLMRSTVLHRAGQAGVGKACSYSSSAPNTACMHSISVCGVFVCSPVCAPLSVCNNTVSLLAFHLVCLCMRMCACLFMQCACVLWRHQSLIEISKI